MVCWVAIATGTDMDFAYWMFLELSNIQKLLDDLQPLKNVAISEAILLNLKTLIYTAILKKL